MFAHRGTTHRRTVGEESSTPTPRPVGVGTVGHNASGTPGPWKNRPRPDVVVEGAVEKQVASDTPGSKVLTTDDESNSTGAGIGTRRYLSLLRHRRHRDTCGTELRSTSRKVLPTLSRYVTQGTVGVSLVHPCRGGFGSRFPGEKESPPVPSRILGRVGEDVPDSTVGGLEGRSDTKRSENR